MERGCRTRGSHRCCWYTSPHSHIPPTPAGHFKTPLPHTFLRFLLSSPLFSQLLILFLRRRSLIPVTLFAAKPLLSYFPPIPFRFNSLPTNLSPSWIPNSKSQLSSLFPFLLQFSTKNKTVTIFILLYLNRAGLDLPYSSFHCCEFWCFVKCCFVFVLLFLWCMACEFVPNVMLDCVSTNFIADLDPFL